MADKRIFKILEEGLKSLKNPKYIFREPNKESREFKPFFSSMSMADNSCYDIEVYNGAVFSTGKNPNRSLHGRIEVRMGNYVKGGGIGSCIFRATEDIDPNATAQKVWDSSNDAFWNCVEDYGQRNLNAIGSSKKRDQYTFFSAEPKMNFIGADKDIKVNLEELTYRFKEASKKLYNDKLLSVEIDFSANKNNRYLVNSEGSKLFKSFLRYHISLQLTGLDKNNRLIPHAKQFYALNPKELPSLDKLLEEGDNLDKELSGIIASPIQKNGSFPVIMDPENHGVLWHEVIGHALEAHRMQDDDDEDNYYDESRVTIFLGKLGHKVAPKFISVYDDPTQKEMDGYYPFDDEGVKAQRVQLIENGVLRNYLYSRSSAGYFKKNSNGHARSSNGNDPVARMSNLIIRSSNEVSFEQLKENLIKECEKQHEKYGLIFENTQGGLTMPEECHFETYPSKIYRIYKNGKTEQVRGIYIVGTPYQVMKGIIQTSDEYGQFRGSCGAESGWVPSVEVASHALIRSLEINRLPDLSYRQLKKNVVPRPKFKK